MEKLNITKGKWVLNPRYNIIQDEKEYGIAQINGAMNEDEWINNAKLIVDAGNTYNKCGLSASELLEQRNELLAALKLMTIQLNQWATQEEGTIGKEWANKALNAIKNCEK